MEVFDLVDAILPEFDEVSPSASEPAPAKRARRKLSDSTRRLFFAVGGGLLAVLSVAGFYFTSSAFDSGSDVLVAAVEIPEGDVITSALLTSARAQPGDIPHLPFSPEAIAAFEGMLAAHTIPAGSIMHGRMAVASLSQPVVDELELLVPLDTSLATSGVAAGDEVLLVDPGRLPTAEDPGRPRSVIEPVVLRDFDGATLRLLLPPEEWSSWRTMLSDLGASPMVMPVPLGGDAAEFGQRLDSVWQGEHETLLARIEALRPVVQPEPQAGPGEIEVWVPLDASLAASGVKEGDRALLIDPGVEPAGDDIGRPRSVIDSIVIQNYSEGRMRLFLPPEEWIFWHTLPDELGGAPMVLPVAPGTDEVQFADVLDEQWRVTYEAALRDIAVPAGSGGTSSQPDAESSPASDEAAPE